MSSAPDRPPRQGGVDWIDLIFRRSSEAVVIGTTTGSIINANAAAERLFGYGPGEMTGLVQADTIDDPERLRMAISQGERTGSFGGELTLVRKDGTRFEGQVFTVRFDAADGQGIWMMIHNLSPLRESEAQFRALSEATFEAVLVHDAGRILFANASAHAMYRCEDLRGSEIFQYVAPESLDLVKRMSLTGDARPYEAVAMRADGTTFATEARGRTIQYRGRAVRIVTMRDISERKRLETDLAARERLAAIGRLAAGVAHEVNNPLTFAMLNLEGIARVLAGEGPIDAQRLRIKEMLDQVQTGLERVSRVVQDMRRFSRVESPRAVSVELGPVLEYATSVAGPELRARAVLNVDVPAGLQVRGDEARLGQVFVNLLANAAESIPEGDREANRVEVRAEQIDESVEVRVTDTGSGIPEAVRPHLFEAFYSTKVAGAGVGLGLSICHAIVTLLGGTIRADAPAGGGTCFVVRLPHADESNVSGDRALPPEVKVRRWRLLAIDDEPLLRSALKHMLVSSCNVVVADGADAALGVLESDAAFDAILCDIVMPGRTGIDFYEELASRFPKMVDRVGFTTGGVLDPAIHDFLERSGRPRVYKPFTLAELIDTVRSLADR